MVGIVWLFMQQVCGSLEVATCLLGTRVCRRFSLALHGWLFARRQSCSSMVEPNDAAGLNLNDIS